MKKFTFGLLLMFIGYGLFSQGNYAGPVGSSTSIAIHKDSSIIKAWAVGADLARGYKNIMDTSLGKTIVGNAQSAVGEALKNGVVSLGDSGVVTLSFGGKIYNAPGPDIVVFENAFDNDFLELAFVEVSSDGQNFFRFPSVSDTDTSKQVGSYETLNTSYIHNLAGKYPIGYGTPFDLSELANIPGLDIQNVTHIRVVDVIGTIADSFASHDSRGIKINDPFPTAWPNGGFDLDAVAAIHIKPTGIEEKTLKAIKVFPNPVEDRLFVEGIEGAEYVIYNAKGKCVKKGSENIVKFEGLAAGIYFLKINAGQAHIIKKIMKR